MFINKKKNFPFVSLKDGRSDSVKNRSEVGLIVGAALAMAGQPHIAKAAMTGKQRQHNNDLK